MILQATHTPLSTALVAIMVPDYYAMLAIDPNSDRAAIEAALTRCQPLWSSGTRNPKNKHTYQSYLDQIPAIRQALLTDDHNRAAYDTELTSTRSAEKDKKLDQLMRLVKLRAAKGGLSVADRSILRDKSGSLGLTKEDLDRLIEPIPARAEPPREEDGPEPIADLLDGTTRRQIRVALEHLARRDLYDALGLLQDAPTFEVAARATAERGRWMQKSQVTAEKTVWLEVISYAQSHIVAPTERVRYDRTLRADAEDSLVESALFAIDGLDRLDLGTRHVLLDEAAAKGIAPDRAEKLIKKACASKGVARDLWGAPPTASSLLRLLRCRSCGGVTNYADQVKGAAHPLGCRHCGASLKWTCPVCQRERWVDELRCTCGLPIEALEPLVRHFSAAQSAFKRRDLIDSLDHLEAARALAPKHPGVQKGFDMIKERQTAIARTRASWEAARSARMLGAGLSIVKAWEAIVAADDPAMLQAWNEVTRGLQSARVLVAQAKSAEGADPAVARGLYRQALSLVADFKEAIEGIKRCPPDPPTRLIVEQHSDRLRLRWSSPADDGQGPVLYRVVRKVGAVPSDATDAELIAETASNSCEDDSALPGETYGYAVFSRRGGIDSKHSAYSGPLLLIGEVQGLRAEARGGEVQLWWVTPRRAVGVSVVRKIGAAPVSPDDGDAIEILRDSAWDKGLADDQVYGYAIYVQYQDLSGQRITSLGSSIMVRPHPPISGLEPPTLRIEPEGRLRLGWLPPQRGAVRILRVPRSVDLMFGSKLSTSELEGLKGVIFEAVGLDHAFDSAPPESETCLYYPLVGWAGEWVVGRPAIFSCLADPTDLRVVRVGVTGGVHLRWRWNPRSSFCLLLAREGEFPTGPDDREAIPIEIDEAEYSRKGYLAWNLPTDNAGAWRIVVYSVAHIDGERFVSSGLELTARTTLPGPNPQITLSYRWRRRAFPGRGWSVILKTDPPGASLPPTVLVVHPRTVPLTADDGELIAHFPACQDGASFPIQATSNWNKDRARIFIDPSTDPDDITPIRIKHPVSEDARA